MSSGETWRGRWRSRFAWRYSSWGRHAQVAASDERLTLAEQELALARQRFVEGVAGNADVVTASLGLSAARTQVVDSRAAFQSARVALARAKGVVIGLP